MTESEFEKRMKSAAVVVKTALPPDTMFVILAASTTGGIARYASNLQQQDVAAWMLETVERWHNENSVPRE